ncbi:hypothetical protein L2E82_23106 [Cichorium intybus]|uniref:Uncharacterized protein n=1 Tax=Cichorium intybus TaxID=13427 RepID=A0ACB9E0M8_CICIN|nr:hypothetical protein L2E82_23106 [Cichorium intybus]
METGWHEGYVLFALHSLLKKSTFQKSTHGNSISRFELGKLYKKWYLDLAPKAADLSRCGYMPSDLYKLNSAYGTQEELRHWEMLY